MIDFLPSVRSRFTTVVLLVVALVGVGCTDRPLEPTAHLLLDECEPQDDPVDALCGTITVFEDREAQQGRTIDLKVIVYPAFRRDPEPDPLFVLVGGPGQGAAQAAEQLIPFFQGVQEERDVVFVDQRGTGDSNLLACEFDDEDLAALSQVKFPVDKLKDCLAGYDADTRFYTTPIAMDDLDQVRTELGYDKINLWGGSYGTRAALVYLRRHGDTVRSVVLDGVAPPGMRLPLAFPADGQRAFDLMLKGCEDDAACNDRFPDIRSRFKSLWSRLSERPRDVVLEDPRTGESEEVALRRELVGGMLMAALYSPETSALLPLLIERAEQDDFQGFIALASLNEAVATQISRGMFFSVVCAEDVPAISLEEAATAAEDTFMGTATYEAWVEACAVWPAGEVDASYRDSVESDVPTLILSGEFDPVTPPRWGEQAAETLLNSRHVVVPGTGHGATVVGCVPKLIEQFIETGTAKDLDTACVEKHERPPFFLSNAGPVAETAE